MGKEYHITESNGIWYAQQFDVRRKLTAHAKLDTIRQLALWIEEMENYSKEEQRNGMDDESDTDYNNYNTGTRLTRVYSYSTEND